MVDKKPMGYWPNRENCLAEARAAIQKEGWNELPTQRTLLACGYSSLSSSIGKYHDGFRAFRKLLGQETSVKPPGYWPNRENCLAEARAAIQKESWDVLPGQNTLKKRGYSSLGFAISKYHGGMNTFRKLLGEENPRQQMGAWKDLEFALAQAYQVMEDQEIDILPSSDGLEKLGHSSLAQAIFKYHGGFREFRKLLSQEEVRKKSGIWKDLEYTLEEARKIMIEHEFSELPSDKALRLLKYHGLSNAINTYHGGFPAFRKLLAERGVGTSEKEQLEGILRAYVEEN